MELAALSWPWIAGSALAGAALGALIAFAWAGRAQAAATARLRVLAEERDRLGEAAAREASRAEQLAARQAALEATLAAERERHREELALLQEARETLAREFENLANRIFEEKQNRFANTSREVLAATVDPLKREIVDFRRQVEEAYRAESAERNRLVGQIQELKAQAARIGEDAVELARALKGDSKLRGNWGEVVLERLLEDAGLTRGREYETQLSLAGSEGERRRPDVVIRLPEGRDIVVDAKVSLVHYERFVRAEGEEERERYLKAHVEALRAHVKGLSRKAYEDLPGINTLDFVFIFVPVEAAFLAAVERDPALFTEAYDQGVILTGPSTLLATLRTVANIWRHEDQHRNARRIAEQAGALYDQFVRFVEALDEVGQHLDRSLKAWQTARNRLVDGRGNLVRRVDALRQMGARVRRELPAALREEAEFADAPRLADGGDRAEES
ncbi:MAG: hypothetical protein KatS3mg124_1025 [Porticoccaceae bacterium]|nr:MAG: hypothetical protein KatS3mg124_1025 [Porticoccaceae bacterium]